MCLLAAHGSSKCTSIINLLFFFVGLILYVWQKLLLKSLPMLFFDNKAFRSWTYQLRILLWVRGGSMHRPGSYCPPSLTPSLPPSHYSTSRRWWLIACRPLGQSWPTPARSRVHVAPMITAYFSIWKIWHSSRYSSTVLEKLDKSKFLRFSPESSGWCHACLPPPPV